MEPMISERKMFTAEIQRLKTQSQKTGESFAPAVGGTAAADILRSLEELKAEVRSLSSSVRGEAVAAPIDDGLTDVVKQKQAEVAMLKTELRALAVCIQQTKVEIAALKPADEDEDRLVAVAFELDAIVSSTERATQQILEAAEKIESLTREIQSHAPDQYVTRLTEDICETIVGIFESCNFQDITGQRITKVVRTLKYVEARIIAMIDIWGAEAFGEMDLAGAPSQETAADDDSKLLNGPQLENKGISQDEIDKLFG